MTEAQSKFEIIDMHQHIGSLPDVMGVRHQPDKPTDPDAYQKLEYETRLKVMQENGIHKGVIMASNAYEQADGIKATMRMNDAVAAYHRKDPTLFPIAAGTVEPLHGERSLEEIDRIKHELKLHAVVWHPRFQGVYIDNKVMRKYLARMRDLRLVPIFHCNAASKLESPWRLEVLANEFPDLHFIALDAFTSGEQAQECLHIAKRTANISFDVTGLNRERFVETFIAMHGSKRILFGTNLYSYPQHYRIARLLHEFLTSPTMSDKDKANILGGNVRHIFGLPVK